MFSNTAYEALYQYIGLELHSKFIEILTSQNIFAAVILLTFAVLFFVTTVQFFSRYMPANMIRRRGVPLSRYFQIVVCLIIGFAVLRVGSETDVQNYDDRSWHENVYVKSNIGQPQASYRVSLVFKLISSTAEEFAALISKVVDQLFAEKHSQLAAPNFFYKAVLYAGSATISDPGLREAIDVYLSDCALKILPFVEGADGKDALDELFNEGGVVDQTLASIGIGDSENYTCLDAKREVRNKLKSYAVSEAGMFPGIVDSYIGSDFGATKFQNTQISNALVDHFLSKSDGFLGLQKGAMAATGESRVLQYLNRITSFDGFLSVLNFGENNLHGASISAKRAQQFNENLTRAPHVAGFIKMGLIAIFPWLVFPIVAGFWRILLYWFVAYFSVLLWTPIWTMLYHIVLNISLSTETMAALGHLSDGISLYSSKILVSKMHYMYAVYSWLQLLVGVAFSGAILWILRPAISDSDRETVPEFVGDTGALAATSSRIAGRL